MYSLGDLERAQAELEVWMQRCANYSGNNTDKYRAEVNSAHRQVEEIRLSLKDSGIIKKSEHEILDDQLNKAFPNARIKEKVEFEGKKYLRKSYPKERNSSGKPISWNRWWEEINE